jgi:hypothetical protein
LSICATSYLCQIIVLILFNHDRTGKEKAIQIGNTFIAAIMKSYEDIPNSFGMKVLRDVPKLESGATRDLVIRNFTEDFWKETICTAETPNKRYHVCAVGLLVLGRPHLLRYLFVCSS